jgi:putative ABC transport system permease protein
MAVRVPDLVRSVRHTFQSSRLRVALTLLGVMIGAGAMVLLAGLLVAGEEALLRLAQGANESDMIELHGADAPRKQAQKTTKPLSTWDAQALSDSDFLRADDGSGAQVNAAARRQATASFKDEDGVPHEKRVTLFGAEPDSRSLYRIAVERGRWFFDEDFAGSRRVCIVGQEVWTELLQKQQDLSDVRVTVDGVAFEVVGVLAHKPTMGHGSGTWMWNRRVLVPVSSYLASFAAPGRQVGGIFVRLKGRGGLSGKVQQLTDVVEATILRRHYGVKDFEAESDARGQGQEKLILRIIEVLLFGTGVIALFVGGINIMNIMLVTVTERTREIGLRRAVGATPAEIARQFLLEAATLAAAGGALGVVGGVVVTGLLSLVLTQLFGEWRFAVEPWSIALALGMATGTGVLFGWLPARRAAQLDPVVALRSE